MIEQIQIKSHNYAHGNSIIFTESFAKSFKMKFMNCCLAVVYSTILVFLISVSSHFVFCLLLYKEHSRKH